MNDVAAFLGMVQSSGGLMVGVGVLAWYGRGLIGEVRSIRKDFNRHEHDSEGKPFLKVTH